MHTRFGELGGIDRSTTTLLSERVGERESANAGDQGTSLCRTRLGMVSSESQLGQFCLPQRGTVRPEDASLYLCGCREQLAPETLSSKLQTVHGVSSRALRVLALKVGNCVPMT